MGELQILSRQQPGAVSIDNFQEARAALAERLARYDGVVYTAGDLKSARDAKKELTSLRSQIDGSRKEIKRTYLAPYNSFEAQIRDLLAMIDVPLGRAKEFIAGEEDREKAARKEEIRAYFLQHSGLLDTMAEQVWESPAFFDSGWLNKSTSVKTWQAAVDEKISLAAQNLKAIQAASGRHAGAVTVRYLETLSMEGIAEYRRQLTAAEKVETAQIETADHDNRVGSRTVRISGSAEALTQAMETLMLLGVDCEVVEDDTPRPMPELTVPDFDSFVAFDLETSGTYGAANGDAPPEITELGAVRVEHGEIVDTFSMLVDPGRKIVPRISRMTHITDEMVAGQPGPEEAVRKFAEFVGDSILVGHNIKAYDLYYIDRASRRAGIRIENPFLDTCCLARTLKESQGWETVGLEDLAKRFGVEQPEAHRAWCDARANVAVYFALKKLREAAG